MMLTDGVARAEQSLPAAAPVPNNIVGLNLARRHQPSYIAAAADIVNANGGAWGYATVLLTREDRDLFVAMDRAMTAPGHGFRQPLSFCWWDDTCWAAIAGKQPGSVGSEPHLRQTFAAALAARAN